jgi:uncharacterized FlaG/YvyC family protein
MRGVRGVKTNTISNKLQIFSQKVNDKGSASEFSQQFNQKNEQENKKEEEKEQLVVSDENVSHAIEKFSKDEELSQHGIQMSMVGTGPGLKVILRDGSGAVIRQLSGEDFLRLKQLTDKDTHKHSRLLNTKV